MRFSGWGGRSAALGAVLLLTACSAPPVSLEPARLPPDFIAHKVVDPSTGLVFESGEAIAGGRVTFEVLKAGTTERLGDAKVTLMGPTLASGTTSRELDLTLQPLKSGTYQARIEAAGYATLLTPAIEVDAANPATVQYELAPTAGDLTGRALDSSNQPLSGAWANVGEAYAFTDANGVFRLKGAPTGPHEVAIAKTGYSPATVQATLSGGETALGDVHLASRPRTVYLENASQEFGQSQSVGTALGALTSALSSEGFTVQTTPSNPTIRILASPTAQSVGDAAATAESLRAFVAAGGKLVLMGEWGGFADYNPDVLNRLAQPYGLAFNPDLVRLGGTTPGWIRIPDPAAVIPAVSPMARGIELFDSCSLLAPAPAVPLASTGSGGFRVSALLNGDFVVAAARPYGRGMVVALGDTSAWATPATQGSGSNLDVLDNRAFILDLFRW